MLPPVLSDLSVLLARSGCARRAHKLSVGPVVLFFCMPRALTRTLPSLCFPRQAGGVCAGVPPSLLAPRGGWQSLASLACRGITLPAASLFTWCSLSVSVLKFPLRTGAAGILDPVHPSPG